MVNGAITYTLLRRSSILANGFRGSFQIGKANSLTVSHLRPGSVDLIVLKSNSTSSQKLVVLHDWVQDSPRSHCPSRGVDKQIQRLLT